MVFPKQINEWIVCECGGRVPLPADPWGQGDNQPSTQCIKCCKKYYLTWESAISCNGHWEISDKGDW